MVEKKDRLATVTLNETDKMNLITPQMKKELIQVKTTKRMAYSYRNMDNFRMRILA